MRRAIRPNNGRNLVSTTKSLPPPVGGLVLSKSIAGMKPTEALQMDNVFPQADAVELRRGNKRHARMPEEAPTYTLMPYHGRTTNKLFAAQGDKIFDVTPGGAIGAEDVDDMSSDKYAWVNFATSGSTDGSFLWICNGIDVPKYFDGMDWDDTAITFPSDPGFPDAQPEDIIGVASYKQRLWLVMKDQTYVAYLGIDAIQGEAATYELGAVMTLGGTITAIETLSRDGGNGPDDLIVFLASTGQAIVYGGNDPEDLATWSIVGVYPLGEPLGRRCLTKVGGDLMILSSDGLLPLSKMIGNDRSETDAIAVTNNIQPAINESARLYGASFGWEYVVYAKGTMGILNVPVVEGQVSQQYVMNTLTKKWCRFTGWNAVTFVVFEGRLFFADGLGSIFEADTGSQDESGAIIGVIQMSFQNYGTSVKKKFNQIQPFLTIDGDFEPKIAVDVDFKDGAAAALPVVYAGGNSLWGEFVWGVDAWGYPDAPQTSWTKVYAIGHVASVRINVSLDRLLLPFTWDVSNWDEANWDEGIDQGYVMRINGFNLIYERGAML